MVHERVEGRTPGRPLLLAHPYLLAEALGGHGQVTMETYFHFIISIKIAKCHLVSPRHEGKECC